MACNKLPFMAWLKFGSGMAPENSEMGTSVTNQKSLFALTLLILGLSKTAAGLDLL